MKTSQLFLTAILATSALFQTACTAKIEGGSEVIDGSGGGNAPAQIFDLNAVNGTWATGCTVSFGYAREELLVLNNGAFTSTSKVYKYDKCLAAELYQSQNSNGHFVVMSRSATATDAYEIEIQTQKSGYIQIEGDLVKFDGTNLYFGDRSQAYNGDYPSQLDMAQAYKKVAP